jgi:hypothetical protein
MTRTLNKINNEYILYASRGQALSLFVALKSIKTPFVIDSSVVLSGKLYTSITSYVEYDLNLSLIDGGIRISLNEFETALLTKSYYMFSVYMQKGLNKVDVISGIINIINNPSDEIDSENMIATHTTDGLLSRTDKVKLDSIAYDASHNSSDEYLLSRENHTGTQPIDTIEGLVDALSLGVGVVGTKGDKGDKGDTGEQGLQGIKGEPGEAGLNTLQTLDASVAIPSINLRSGTLVNITQITGNFTMPTIDVNPVLPVNEGILGSIILNWVVGAVGSHTVIVGDDTYVVNDVSKGFKLDYVVASSEIRFDEVIGSTLGDIDTALTTILGV